MSVPAGLLPPTAPVSLDQLGPRMREVLRAAREHVSPAPGRVLLAAGAEVAWDDCCRGQLWVRVVNLAPLVANRQGSPGLVAGSPGCGVLRWHATLGVGIVRCAAVVDDRGNAPSALTLTREAEQMTADASALSHGLLCSGLITRVVGWSPLGPLGGCVGGEWQIVTSVDLCPCPDD